MAHERETLKKTAVFSFFTVLSRILGLGRDMLKAYAFGTNLYAVAFDVAFRLPNMLRNLVAEGALSQAFVPLYETYRQKSQEEARKAAGVVVQFMVLILGSFTLLFVFLAPYLVPFFVAHDSLEKIQLTVELSRILFPYIVLMSIAAIYMAVEYSHGIFWAPAFGPALLNLVTIIFFGGYLWLAKILHKDEAAAKLIYVFAFITLFAGLIQLLFQMASAHLRRIGPLYGGFVKHRIIGQLFTMMLPAVFSSGIHEIGQLIDIYLATSLENKVPGAVSALTYAHRLIHLPMGVFGVALSTAALPQLSRFFAANEEEKFRENLLFSLKANVFLILPAVLGLIVFGQPIVGLIFERGEFQKASTEITAYALQFYAPGILAFSLQKLFSSSFYAQKDTKTPAIISALVLVLNISFSIFFMQFLRHGGLALGSSLAAYGGVFLYVRRYSQRGLLKNTAFFKKSAPIWLLNLIFLLFLLLLRSFFMSFSYLVQLMLSIPLAVGFYWFAGRYLKIEEVSLLEDLLAKLWQKIRQLS